MAARVYELPNPFDPAEAHCERLLCDFGLEYTPQADAQPRSAAAEWASSGAMSLTGSSEGPPQFVAGALASAAQGAARALRTLAPGACFDKLDAPALLGERAALAGLSRRGMCSVGGSARLLTSASGTIALNLPRDEDWQLMPALLESDPIDLTSTRDWKFVEDRVARLERAPLVERARMMGLAIAPAERRPPDNTPLFSMSNETEMGPDHGRNRKLRLLDLTSLWAGPLATSLLAMAGIDVLKIESPGRPDGARHGDQPFFDLLNGNKRGCTLDLHCAEDRSLFEQLLESADVVVESARPRGLGQLGFDAASWVENRPARLWASITGYGRSNDAIAFGDDAAMAAGLGWPVDGSEPGPRFCGDAIADPLTGLHAAFLILAHLTLGRGGLLDLSLMDITAHAAKIEHDGLVLPSKTGSTQPCVIEEGRRIPIQPARARDVSWTAPPLAPMTERRLAEWTRSC